MSPLDPFLRQRPFGEPRGDEADTVDLRDVACARREPLGDAHALLDGRPVAEFGEGLGHVQGAVE